MIKRNSMSSAVPPKERTTNLDWILREMSKYINSISDTAKESKRNEFQLYFGGRLVDVGNALDVEWEPASNNS